MTAGVRRHDDIDLEPDEFVREPAQSLKPAIGITEFDSDILPVGVTVLAQHGPELGPERLWIGDEENANSGQLHLLRPRQNR